MSGWRVLCFTLLFALFACAPMEPPPPRVVESDARILMVVTSADRMMDGSDAGYYLQEVVEFYKVVNAAGFAVDIASAQGGTAPMYNRGVELSGGKKRAFIEQTGLLRDLDESMPLTEVDPNRYLAVYFVGGFAATMDFSSDPRVAQVGAEVYESGGVVAAVCHGPTALVNLKLSDGKYLVRGKRVTSRTVQEDGHNKSGHLPFLLELALKDRGADFRKGPPGTPHVEVDGRLITGQGPSATSDVAKALVEQLASR